MAVILTSDILIEEVEAIVHFTYTYQQNGRVLSPMNCQPIDVALNAKQKQEQNDKCRIISCIYTQ